MKIPENTNIILKILMIMEDDINDFKKAHNVYGIDKDNDVVNIEKTIYINHKDNIITEDESILSDLFRNAKKELSDVYFTDECGNIYKKKIMCKVITMESIYNK